ncbi:hypothetical protein ACHAXS_013740 [Conticribra weissflogii]
MATYHHLKMDHFSQNSPDENRSRPTLNGRQNGQRSDPQNNTNGYSIKDNTSRNNNVDGSNSTHYNRNKIKMHETHLHILSATYGPSEGRRLLDGTLVDFSKKESYVPHSRDVLPFVLALMETNNDNGEESEHPNNNSNGMSCDGGQHGMQWEATSSGDNSTDSHSRNGIQRKRKRSSSFCGVEPGDNVIIVHSNKNSFPLMDGKSMNAVFGDPCPGTTKLLRVEYFFKDFFYSVFPYEDNSGGKDIAKCTPHESNEVMEPDGLAEEKKEATKHPEHSENAFKSLKNFQHECTTSRLFQSSFAEHERVLLKRQDPLFRLTNPGQNFDEADLGKMETQMEQLQQNGEDFNMNDINAVRTSQLVPIATSQRKMQLPQSPSAPPAALKASPSKQWKLAPTISEITLPIILPFLTVRQRGLCQLVCSSWRDIVMEKGIAVIVDINDIGLFPKHVENASPLSGHRSQNASQSTTSADFSLRSALADNSSPKSPSLSHRHSSLLRGLLTHSHYSLESLVLNDFIHLRPNIDIHPTLPHLRKLKRLDISRIPSITDETLHLISTHVGSRLEVLYMKGLRNVTNEGVVHLVQSCRNLRVLDVSRVHHLDDEVGKAIGTYLNKLEVLHGRDNYRWTNDGVDIITRNCRKLVQLTLWGCIRLTHVDFHHVGKNGHDPTIRESSMADQHIIPVQTSLPPPKLVLLNLWGCHNLTDEAALLMTSLPQLRSLCVSECHKLTDRFVHGISQSLPQLVHLQLRYLRRLTDSGIDAISSRMPGLYSLDVSFCTKLTINGLVQLLRSRSESLAELRLYSCRQLDLEGSNGGMGANGRRAVGGGQRLVQALKTERRRSILSFLDLRKCYQHEPFSRDELFLNGMSGLGFDEPMNGLFVRRAQWNGRVREQLGDLVSKLNVGG